MKKLPLLSLTAVEERCLCLAERIQAPLRLLPSFGPVKSGEGSYVEVTSLGYRYAGCERGSETELISTTELDELLYLVFESITFSMAVDYELRHRDSSKDARRVIFPYQLQLLSQLGVWFAERGVIRIAKILEGYPYDDQPSKDLLRLHRYQSIRSWLSTHYSRMFSRSARR